MISALTLIAATLTRAIGTQVEVYVNPANTHLFVHSSTVDTVLEALRALPEALGHAIHLDAIEPYPLDGTPYAMVGVLNSPPTPPVLPDACDVYADAYMESVIEAAGEF